MKRPIAILISLALLILSYPLQANSLPKQFLDKMAELKQPLTRHVIVVDVTSQKLFLYNDHKIVTSYPISTSSKGTGQESNSYKTPLGAHRIAEKLDRTLLLMRFLWKERILVKFGPLFLKENEKKLI